MAKVKVFITQETSHDFRQAREYGELVFLSDGRKDDFYNNANSPANRDLIDRLYAGLHDYTDNDYVVLVGSPYVQGAVMWILGNLGNKMIRLLRWDNRDMAYIPLELRMF